MKITDSHNHLHFDSYDNDRNETLNRAYSSGVDTMLLVGIDPHDSQKALDVSSRSRGIFVSLGIHPQKAKEYNSNDVSNLRNLFSSSKVVAIGETGFDLFRSPDTEEMQKQLFLSHIELARELSLPLIIHDRDAHKETLSILDSSNAWSFGGVFHCFSGDLRMASHIIAHGFYISISGVVTYKNASILKEVVSICPLDKILVETDAPFLAPVPYRGKRNEPSFIVTTLEEIAKIKNCSFEEISKITTENFYKLFLTKKSS